MDNDFQFPNKPKRKLLLVWIILILLVICTGYFLIKYLKKNQNNVQNSTTEQNINSNSQNISVTENKNGLVAPIDEFKERITKKPFGIYITPQNSPAQPEKFTGFHTGIDVEYQDVGSDVPVYAVADAKILAAKTVSGYGGVIIISLIINGVEHSVLYGHIRPSTLPKIGSNVKKGEQLALLGTGYSSETDGERKHLHFAILSDSRIDYRGYVQNKSELSSWIDPLTLYK